MNRLRRCEWENVCEKSAAAKIIWEMFKLLQPTSTLPPQRASNASIHLKIILRFFILCFPLRRLRLRLFAVWCELLRGRGIDSGAKIFMRHFRSPSFIVTPLLRAVECVDNRIFLKKKSIPIIKGIWGCLIISHQRVRGWRRLFFLWQCAQFARNASSSLMLEFQFELELNKKWAAEMKWDFCHSYRIQFEKILNLHDVIGINILSWSESG